MKATIKSNGGGTTTTNRLHRCFKFETPTRSRYVVPATVMVVFIFTIQSLILPWYCFPNDGTTSHVTMYNVQQTVETHGRILPSSDLNANHQHKERPTPDGYFNTYPVYLQSNKPFHSTAHCVGETHYEETAWMHRSCDYTYLCLDPQNKEFFIVASPIEQELQRRRVQSGSYISTELLLQSSNGTTDRATHNYSTPSLALGGINPRWNGKDFNQGIDKVKWSPRVVRTAPAQYYLLEDDVVLVPFHSFAGHNVGHLLWDDFLPIFTLLHIFGFLDYDAAQNMGQPLQPQPYRHLLLRVDTLPLLYATCEIRRNKRLGCASNFEKFLPLMGINPKSFTTLKQIKLTKNNDGDVSTNGGEDKNRISPFPICAKHAAAGIGMLTDHGMKDHGWEPLPTDVVHNVGRGPLLYQFRNYMLRNMNLPVIPVHSSLTSPSNAQTGQQPFHIVLNAHSSRDSERDVDFQEQQRMLTQVFPTAKVSVVRLSDYTLQEQMELVSQNTNIFVSTCGGGSMTGFFLPRGASIVLYYAEKSGFNFHKYALTGGPAILDWDLFNNLGYLRTHWLPIGTMNTKEGLDSLVYLIQHEMDVAKNAL